jgi:hypothetical protein
MVCGDALHSRSSQYTSSVHLALAVAQPPRQTFIRLLTGFQNIAWLCHTHQATDHPPICFWYRQLWRTVLGEWGCESGAANPDWLPFKVAFCTPKYRTQRAGTAAISDYITLHIYKSDLGSSQNAAVRGFCFRKDTTLFQLAERVSSCRRELQ